MVSNESKICVRPHTGGLLAAWVLVRLLENGEPGPGS
jgi:hypothetical protein